VNQFNLLFEDDLNNLFAIDIIVLVVEKLAEQLSQEDFTEVTLPGKGVK
jgi:hypothetical protein